jgi:hypothetical protein
MLYVKLIVYGQVITAAELQLEAAGGQHTPTSFVTVKVTVDEESNTVVEGFQVSKQCMEMVAEGVLELTVHLGHFKVNPTFTVVQEGKNTNEVIAANGGCCMCCCVLNHRTKLKVDVNFFLNNVPIARHESITFVATFPRLNREIAPTQEDLKRQLSK